MKIDSSTAAVKANEIYPWVRYWDSRLKTAAVVVFIFGVVCLNNAWLLLLALTLVLIAALNTGYPPGSLFAKLVLLAPFLIIMSVPLVLGGGFPPPPHRVELAVLLSLKALISMTSMIILLVTQPLEEFLDSLSHIKLPPLFITIFYLTYRYVHLFIQEKKNLEKALVSRLFRGGLHKRALTVYGELSGGIIVKAIDRSENVYRAMSARNFRGIISSGAPKTADIGDVLKTVMAVVFVTVLLLMQWLVL